jgi:hypothetical protein
MGLLDLILVVYEVDQQKEVDQETGTHGHGLLLHN